MTTRSFNPNIRSVCSNHEAVLRGARLFEPCNVQLAGAEKAAKMVKIRVPDLWNKENAIAVQETTHPPVTGR